MRHFFIFQFSLILFLDFGTNRHYSEGEKCRGQYSCAIPGSNWLGLSSIKYLQCIQFDRCTCLLALELCPVSEKIHDFFLKNENLPSKSQKNTFWYGRKKWRGRWTVNNSFRSVGLTVDWKCFTRQFKSSLNWGRSVIFSNYFFLGNEPNVG